MERIHTADEIGKLRLELKGRRESRDEPMLLIGDFNCEPFDRPFNDRHSLRAVRERDLVVRPGNQKAYFYNPTWRWLYVSPEDPSPHGTYSSPDGSHLYDQVMVTKEMIEAGASLRLIELSLTKANPEAKCSDHFAIGITLEIGD